MKVKEDTAMDKSTSVATMTHFRRLSWKARVSESKGALVLFFVAMLFGLICGAIIPFVYTLAHPAVGTLAPLFFLGGLLASFTTIYGVRFVDRKVFGAMKTGIIAVEDRLITGNSKTQMEDLEKLVAGYLKLKRMEAADFYSKKLLELSKSGSRAVMNLKDWMVTTECWASTSQYHKGWSYKLVWLFETRGVLTLSPTRIDFQSKKFHFSCNPKTDIVALELKQHPLWLKPIPFRYISLTINEGGLRHTFNITPSFGQTDTVFDCNKMVETWFQRLQNVRSYDTYSHNHQVPDWLHDCAN